MIIINAINGDGISHLRKSSNNELTQNKKPNNNTMLDKNNNRILYSFNAYSNNDPKTVQYKHFIDTIGIKTSGNGWKVWDRMSPLYYTEDTCKNTAIFRGVQGTSEIEMCIHENDVVSQNINEKGRFIDCDELVNIWNKVAVDNNDDPNEKNIFLDIGANIGACTMEMLVSTNAYIIAFEPTPINLSKLTSTLYKNKSYLDRVALYPIGLSDISGTSIINSAKGNLGNSVIDVIIKDGDLQQFYEPVTIQLDTLDNIFLQSLALDNQNIKYNIPLIKMDVQGYECHVVTGGKHVLKYANAIKTEFIEKWFLPHNCSEEKLQYLLNKELNFELLKEGPFDVIGYNKNKH